MAAVFNKLSNVLFGRVARNIYIWVWLIYTVLALNYGNERVYHYGIIRSSWYYPFVILGFIFQIAFTYANNLWLAPKYLRNKQYLKYFLSAAILVVVASVIYTCGVKIANTHMRMENMQQPSFVSAPVSNQWTFSALVDDTVTYLSGNVGWLFVFTMAWFMNEYGRQSKLIEEAQKRQTETELNFLKNQINPHFLFNTLNNLYGLALKHAENAPDAILKLSSILRYLLYESNTPVVAFSKEKDVIYAYVELELLRITDTSGLHFTVHADREDYDIPPLLWLPVLENLFKHGTRIITDDIRGDFKFVIEQNVLTIACANNYKGMLQMNEEKSAGGIGLKNLEKRLELLYPKKHKIDVVKSEGEYSITITVEL